MVMLQNEMPFPRRVNNVDSGNIYAEAFMLRVLIYAFHWRRRQCSKRAACAAVFKLHSDWCFIVANEIKYLTVFVFSRRQLSPRFLNERTMQHLWNIRQRKSSRKCAACGHCWRISWEPQAIIYPKGESIIKTCKSIFLWCRAPNFLLVCAQASSSLAANMRYFGLALNDTSSVMRSPHLTPNAKYNFHEWKSTRPQI